MISYFLFAYYGSFDEWLSCPKVQWKYKGQTSAAGPCPSCGGVDRFGLKNDAGVGIISCRKCQPKEGNQAFQDILKAAFPNRQAASKPKTQKRPVEVKGWRYTWKYGQGYKKEVDHFKLSDGQFPWDLRKAGLKTLSPAIKAAFYGEWKGDLDSPALWISEGEKDAISLFEAGQPATTLFSTNAKINKGMASKLANKKIVLAFDHDDEGRKATHRHINELAKSEYAIELYCVQWPDGFKVKGDVSDYLKDHTLDELRSIAVDYRQWQANNPLPSKKESRTDEVKYDEVDLAMMFASAHKERFIFDMKDWFVFDDDTRRFSEANALAFNAMRDHIKSRVSDSQRNFNSNYKIKAVLHIAANEMAFQEGFDTNKAVLGCSNGDALEIGADDNGKPHFTIRQARFDDFLTKSLGATPLESELNNDQWQDKSTYPEHFTSGLIRALEKRYGDDASKVACVIGWCIGAALVHDVEQEKFLLVHGLEGAGKGTLIADLMAWIFGHYHHALSPDYLDARNRAAHPEWMMRFKDRRLCVINEVPPGMKLPNHIVSRLVSGESFSARDLNKSRQDFRPMASLIIVGNERPSGSDGVRRRAIPIMFSQIDKGQIDTKTKDKVRGERDAILTWCLMRYKDGLHIPNRLEADMAEYAESNDPNGEWIRAQLFRDAAADAYLQDIYRSYSQHCELDNVKPLGSKRLKDKIETIFPDIRYTRKSKGMAFVGLRLTLQLTDSSQ